MMDGYTHPLYRRFVSCAMRMIGAGGIGSNVASLLAKCGPPLIELWDDDTVADVNLQMQQFGAGDIGEHKAPIVAAEIRRLNPTTRVIAHTRLFTPADYLDGVVIAAVDSLEGRQMIFDAVLAQCRTNDIPLYLDGRFNRRYPGYFELYAIDPREKAQVGAYEDFLFRGRPPLPKAPRPTTLAAHAPYGLAWAIGSVLDRWISGEDRPWKVVGDGKALSTEVCMVSEL